MSNRILIIGGGLSGLALASGLRFRGVEPMVVEQAPVITEAGWAIGEGPDHLAALDRLGFTDRHSWPSHQAAQHLMFDGRTGLLDAFGMESATMFRRSDLQANLLKEVDDLVRCGVRPSRVTDRGDSVEVEFDDGTRETFGAVIGADGINSWTRRHVLGGPEATYVGMAVRRFIAPNPDSALNVSALVAGEENPTLAFFLTNGGKDFYGLVFLSGPESNRRELTLEQLADLVPNTPGPFAVLTEAMRANPPSFYSNIRQAVVDTWTRNRVAIIGDAAHAMTPVLGQGSGAGFADAALLADLLTVPYLSVPAALASYEKLRKPAVQAMQRLSHEASLAIPTSSSATEVFPTLAQIAEVAMRH
jgi:FAD-dependent urate hydroxylase